MLGTILRWLTGGPLSRILDTVDKTVDNETMRQRIRSEVTTEWIKASVERANSKQWWFALFFVVPLGVWFGAVCLYSVFLCRNCMFPQEWTIAALPPPLDDWSWVIIAAVCGVAAYTGRK